MGRVEISKKSLAVSIVYMVHYLLEALKGKPSSSVFSTDGTLISAFTAPHCRMGGGGEAERVQGRNRISSHCVIVDFQSFSPWQTLVFSSSFFFLNFLHPFSCYYRFSVPYPLANTFSYFLCFFSTSTLYWCACHSVSDGSSVLCDLIESNDIFGQHDTVQRKYKHK